MMMIVLKLMDVSNLGKVLFIYMGICLKLTHSLEDPTIRFIYFHLLKLLIR
jgi:hypothetical protein